MPIRHQPPAATAAGLDRLLNHTDSPIRSHEPLDDCAAAPHPEIVFTIGQPVAAATLPEQSEHGRTRRIGAR